MAFFAERFAGALGFSPGMNIAPAHAKGSSGATTRPWIESAPLEPCAPPLRMDKTTVDLPPATVSVESVHPAPKRVLGWSSSKSLTQPLSEPGGTRLFDRARASAIAFACA